MSRSRVWKVFIFNISLIVVIFLTGIFVGFVFRTNQIIRNQVTITARAHFKNIVLTRRWNAGYGGVYVEKAHGIASNPYLDNPDIAAADGRIFTMKNPALMTREISSLAEKSGDFQYHITSLRPLNPNNAPDDFERAALLSFESGAKETFDTFTRDTHATFRYMAPLYVEKSCMACHAKQGYQVGEVRGGISVMFDITAVETDMRTNTIYVFALTAAISLAMLGVIWFLVSRLARRLSRAYETIEAMSITDELTSLYNRRHFQTRLEEELGRAQRYDSPLSLMIIDIDHFKRVNDDFGHQSGDAVLREFAIRLRASVRKTDVAARWGGEEFAVILTESGVDQARLAAEKIRQTMEANQFGALAGARISVTASFGVASLDLLPEDKRSDSEMLIKLADEALYMAKQSGRNRTVVGGVKG
ncbi:MAG: diguanylate cyclase [Desulfatibacillum sp.]|nr:diguanylate cyclase [Desulfatibacillum sp.]